MGQDLNKEGAALERSQSHLRPGKSSKQHRGSNRSANTAQQQPTFVSSAETRKRVLAALGIEGQEATELTDSDSDEDNRELHRDDADDTTGTSTEEERRKRSGRVLEARADYTAATALELSFKKGDQLFFITERSKDWIYARHAVTGKSGLVPSRFVAIAESVDAEDWFFGKITRRDAENFLLPHEKGTYLVRYKELAAKSQDVEFALSVRGVGKPFVDAVKHYRIKFEPGVGYYMQRENVFTTMKALIEFYSNNDEEGLCSRLSRPCKRPEPKREDMGAEADKMWELPKSEFNLIEKVGAGNFGEVWRATWRSVLQVAVKMLKPGTMESADFLKEAQMMKKLDHPNLVKLFGVCTKDEPYYIITEYLPNGSLRDYLLKGEGRDFGTAHFINITAQVATGMAHLESKQVIHRDLAARNVLVGFKHGFVPPVKVADFGLAGHLKDVNKSQKDNPDAEGPIPVKWAAPEVLTAKKFSSKSDVWAFGVFIIELFGKGAIPYPLMSNAEVMEKIPKGYRMSCPRGMPAAVFQMAEKCWAANPQFRPSFKALMIAFDKFGHDALDDDYAKPGPVSKSSSKEGGTIKSQKRKPKRSKKHKK